jgi:hypothetical protein
MNIPLKLYIISELQRTDIITSPKTIESIYKWLEQPAQDKYRKNLLYKKGYKKIKAIK